jgi:6-phosphogluconolactonase
MYAYVGCYTAPDRGGRGQGIGIFRMDETSGAWHGVGTVEADPNPAFLALHPRGDLLYAVHGGDGAAVSAFARDRATGALTLLDRQPCGGTNPVHLALTPDGRTIVVANYTGGTVAALPVGPDGRLGPPGSVLPLRGTPGPDPQEQDRPHPHHSPFDPAGRFAIIPDKGLDRLFVFAVGAEPGTIAPHEPRGTDTARGAGPRHIAFAPAAPYAYVVNELDSTVTTYRYDAEMGTLTPFGSVSSLPGGWAGKNTGSEIAVSPDGRFVYASNRGHDSIAIFVVGADGGLLRAIGWEPTGGRTPRFFGLDPSGTFLYAANQDSDTIVAFRVDRAVGLLSPTGQAIASGSPSCIVFAE